MWIKWNGEKYGGKKLLHNFFVCIKVGELTLVHLQKTPNTEKITTSSPLQQVAQRSVER